MTTVPQAQPITTPAQQVRLLITDRFIVGSESTAPQFFADTEIDAFLALEGNNVWQAAATALETIATTEVLLLEVQRIGAFQTDGAKVSDALLRRAALLRARGNRLGVALAARPHAGGISRADKATTTEDSDAVPPYFTRRRFTGLGAGDDLASSR